MGRALVLLLAFLSLVCGHSSFVPTTLWSDKQIFTQSQVTDTISSSDIEFMLNSIIHKNTNEKVSKISGVLNLDLPAPEVLVMFVEPELRTDQFPYFASAFAIDNTHGAYHNLQNILESAGSKLTVPYTNVEQVTLLDETLTNMFENVDGSVFVASVSGSKLFSRLKQLSGVNSIELGSLVDELATKGAFSNDKTDLVVVCFDRVSAMTASQHDAIIGSVSTGIQSGTKGNYVAAYVANMPTNGNFVWTFAEESKAELLRSTTEFFILDTIFTNSTNSTINYFPGPFIEALLVSSILLAMLFTGACAIFSLQTPDKWEIPRSNKRSDL